MESCPPWLRLRDHAKDFCPRGTGLALASHQNRVHGCTRSCSFGDAILEFFVHPDAAAAPPCKSDEAMPPPLWGSQQETQNSRRENKKCFWEMEPSSSCCSFFESCLAAVSLTPCRAIAMQTARCGQGYADRHRCMQSTWMPAAATDMLWSFLDA